LQRILCRDFARVKSTFCYTLGRRLILLATPPLFLKYEDVLKRVNDEQIYLSVGLPHSIKKAARRLAKKDGVSLNQWIATAVAQKIGVVETAAGFFKKRAGNAKGDGLMKYVRNAPRVAPEPDDEIR
jgi:hypothetical protein